MHNLNCSYGKFFLLHVRKITSIESIEFIKWGFNGFKSPQSSFFLAAKTLSNN